MCIFQIFEYKYLFLFLLLTDLNWAKRAHKGKMRAMDGIPPSLPKVDPNPNKIGGDYSKQNVSRAPVLTPKQIEFVKKFFRNLDREQKMAESGVKLPYGAKGMRIPKGTEIKADWKENLIRRKRSPSPAEGKKRQLTAPGGKGKYKNAPSGGAIFFDSLCHTFFPVGDPYSGAPDGPISMAKWCIELFIKGALAIIYAVVRWPHKILSKMMMLTAAIGFIPNTLLWCLNPISISRFISKSLVVNQKFDELAAIQYKHKVRVANIIDKVHGLKDIQELGCCSYLAFKSELIETVDQSAKEFLSNWMNSFFKLNQIVYCGEYVEDTGACDNVKFDDEEPLRVIPRGPVPLYMELFAIYF